MAQRLCCGAVAAFGRGALAAVCSPLPTAACGPSIGRAVPRPAAPQRCCGGPRGLPAPAACLPCAPSGDATAASGAMTAVRAPSQRRGWWAAALRWFAATRPKRFHRTALSVSDGAAAACEARRDSRNAIPQCWGRTRPTRDFPRGFATVFCSRGCGLAAAPSVVRPQASRRPSESRRPRSARPLGAGHWLGAAGCALPSCPRAAARPSLEEPAVAATGMTSCLCPRAEGLCSSHGPRRPRPRPAQSPGACHCLGFFGGHLSLERLRGTGLRS